MTTTIHDPLVSASGGWGAGAAGHGGDGGGARDEIFGRKEPSEHVVIGIVVGVAKGGGGAGSGGIAVRFVGDDDGETAHSAASLDIADAADSRRERIVCGGGGG